MTIENTNDSATENTGGSATENTNNSATENTSGSATENTIHSAVDCAVACVNGCIKGDACPNEAYTQQTSSFIEHTSLDKMLEMAEEAVRKKMIARATEPRKWVIPDELK